MRAFSLKQPWAWAVLHAGKNTENRKWRLPKHIEGQRIVIHASKNYDPEAYEYLLDLHHRGLIPEPPKKGECPQGALLGEVTVGGCRRVEEIEDPNHWQFGPYCFDLADPEAYDTPIPFKGALWFFEIGPAI